MKFVGQDEIIRIFRLIVVLFSFRIMFHLIIFVKNRVVSAIWVIFALDQREIIKMELFENIKMIASDMDGTLLDSNHEWSPSFLSELKKLTDKGILFVAASGRQYYN
ncbi:MAG: HAD family hydrolase, partial [Bacteroidales bacterium]